MPRLDRCRRTITTVALFALLAAVRPATAAEPTQLQLGSADDVDRCVGQERETFGAQSAQSTPSALNGDRVTEHAWILAPSAEAKSFKARVVLGRR
ncbi:MAG: hypothetical protein H6747_13335 [Deltaproteobacteria bacterium]|nr:hypothetical protein [Deltaproteobacteria bacterium]